MRFWVPLPALLSGCLLPTDVNLGRNLPDHVVDLDPPTGTELIDRDQDGVTVLEGDCDDLDPNVAPGKSDPCDGLDDDCDGVVDGDNICARESRFEQETKSDVLVVVDSSYDMSSYWWLASIGATAMTEHLVGARSDIRIGVLFNDMQNDAYSGKLVSPAGFGDLWIEGSDTRLDATRIRSFFDQALLYQKYEGPNGDAGIRWAVERAIQLSDSSNKGFFRYGADLFLVVVTNQDDNPVVDNTQFLTDLLPPGGALSGLTVYAVTQTIDDPDSCLTLSGGSPATSVISLVEQTGGFYESVCMPDWTGFLSGVGQSIADKSLKTTFTLDAPAQLDSLTVWIDPNDGGARYKWDTFALSDPTTLVFPDAAPPLGSTIIVDYLEDWRY